MRTMKYDEHLNEFTAETHVTGKRGEFPLEALESTPPIAQDLDTTKTIEELIASAEHDDQTDSDSSEESVNIEVEEVHPDLEDSLQFLTNVYDLHHIHHYVYISYHEVEQVEIGGIVTKEQEVDEDDKILTENVTPVAEEVRQTKEDSNNAREITEGEEIKEKVEEVQMKEDEKGYPEVRMKSENIKLLSIKLADKNRECDLLQRIE